MVVFLNEDHFVNTFLECKIEYTYKEKKKGFAEAPDTGYLRGKQMKNPQLSAIAFWRVHLLCLSPLSPFLLLLSFTPEKKREGKLIGLFSLSEDKEACYDCYCNNYSCEDYCHFRGDQRCLCCFWFYCS